MLIDIPNTGGLYKIRVRTREVVSFHKSIYEGVIRKWKEPNRHTPIVHDYHMKLFLKKVGFKDRYITKTQVELIIREWKMRINANFDSLSGLGSIYPTVFNSIEIDQNTVQEYLTRLVEKMNHNPININPIVEASNNRIYYIIGQELPNGEVRFNTTPKKFWSVAEVTAEVERLVKEHPGSTFTYFTKTHSCTTQGVIWK